MNRRQFILTLKGTHQSRDAFPENPPSEKGIAPYLGSWGAEDAAHLLRRTIFGPTLAQMAEVSALGLDAAVDLLLSEIPLPTPPLNVYDESDSYVPIGETWVGKTLEDNNTDFHINTRRKSLKAWGRLVLTGDGLNIREKMTLFWQNHFATGFVKVPEANYQHITLLRTQALGNFRQLIKDVTIDAHMLHFLNGNENIDEAPNENYARELLELYTIGKGPLVGAGDYTNYTEEDVIQCAKLLTGWSVRNPNSTDNALPLEVAFSPALHTQGNKTLSHRFANAVIAENGAEEYKDLIDIIFNQPAVAKFIVTKIYRFFVYYDITETVIENVINPLAQVLIDNNYEIKSVMLTLLKSEHFYDTPSRGCLIKNSIDFLESAYVQLNWQPPADLTTSYKFSKMFSNYQISLGMEYFRTPSVSGWKAYYQSPSFHRFWINPITYQKRNILKNIFLGGGVEIEDVDFGYDEIALVQLTSNPSMPDVVVDEFTKLFLPLPVNNSLKIYLKTGFLIPGLPDAEWTMEYENYLNSPGDENIKKSVAKKINNLVKAIMELPEYQLS